MSNFGYESAYCDSCGRAIWETHAPDCRYLFFAPPVHWLAAKMAEPTYPCIRCGADEPHGPMCPMIPAAPCALCGLLHELPDEPGMCGWPIEEPSHSQRCLICGATEPCMTDDDLKPDDPGTPCTFDPPHLPSDFWRKAFQSQPVEDGGTMPNPYGGLSSDPLKERKEWTQREVEHGKAISRAIR